MREIQQGGCQTPNIEKELFYFNSIKIDTKMKDVFGFVVKIPQFM